MYPLNKPLSLTMPVSVFCLFLSACGGQSGVQINDDVAYKQAAESNQSNSSNQSKGSNQSSRSNKSVITLNTLKAFPTAEGAGAIVTGGRGGKVVYVTNTNEKGPGSLFDAITGHGNEKRTIVFAVGGRFNISTWEWQENKGNFTLAGQTANDLGGVHLVSIPYHENSEGSQYSYYQGDTPANGSLFLTHSDNMAIRYLSATGGWESGIGLGARFNAFGTNFCSEVIYDHYSSGFSSYLGKLDGVNENTKRAGNITMQYSLGFEGIDGQNVGFVLGDYVSDIADREIGDAVDIWRNNFGRVDFHHNAFILNTHRQTGNIYAGESGKYKRISNYIYNIGSRLDSFVGKPNVDYINNVYEAGPAEEVDFNKLHKFQISYEAQPENENMETSLYFSGNQVIKQDGSNLIGPNDDQWQMVQMKLDEPMRSVEDGTPISGLDSGDSVPKVAPYYRSRPISKGRFPITVTPTQQVKNHVLANSGAGIRFNASGSTYNVDEVDRRYIKTAQNHTGPTFYSSSYGDGGIGDPARFTYPVYPSKKLDLNKFDSDRDGLPDAWEKKHKVSDANAVKRNWKIQGYTIINKAGYTNLEMYLAERAGDFHMLAKK